MSAQTVRNRLGEVHLRARRPSHGLDLTAVWHHSQLQWANAQLRWQLTHWRSVLFMDESQFQLYRADETC
jgi:hypothetical protein